MPKKKKNLLWNEWEVGFCTGGLYIENSPYCAFYTSRRNYGASVQSEYSIVYLIQESRYFIGHLRLLV